jgi:hypothetical protein
MQDHFKAQIILYMCINYFGMSEEDAVVFLKNNKIAQNQKVTLEQFILLYKRNASVPFFAWFDHI